MKKVFSLMILALSYLSCDATTAAADGEITCSEKTRPHSTECNKYFKCIRLPTNNLKWITLTCQEGLIYDNNLRSCAIPDENWDCVLGSEKEDDHDEDEKNIYGIENLNLLETGEGSEEDYRSVESDDFLEVIDGDEILGASGGESRSENSDEHADDESSNFSGDGNVAELVTQSTPTIQMITTQVQRLTQLMKNHPKNNVGDDLTADDLNSYLDVHKIQSKSPDYQSNKFDLSDKTPVPSNGRIHPEIMSEILSKQTQLNTFGLRETTLAMDAVTHKPMLYVNKEPITEIHLKSGQGGVDSMGTHQIVVNRPEGAVVFNVPSSPSSPEKSNSSPEHAPYLSSDILKAILEISKQMVTHSNNNQNKNSDRDGFQSPPHPIYYAIPFPIFSPTQNNIPTYYNHYMNNSMGLETTTTSSTTTIMPPVTKVRRRKPAKGSSKMKNRIDFMGQNVRTPQENYNQQQQQPVDYYSYFNNYQQNYPSYGPMNYPYQQYSGNDGFTSPNKNMYSSNRLGNLYGNFYENRPLVSDSSAPAIIGSYVDHLSYSTPHQKESFPSSSSSSYSSDVRDNDEYDALHDESDESENGVGLIGSLNGQMYEDDEPPEDATNGLICSFGITRQANKTDCMRYYVCNSKTKEVLSYLCPSSTAFNDLTKYCDSSSFAACKKAKDREQGQINNKKYFQEAHKALQQAKLESQKAERLANLVRKESQKILNNKAPIGNAYDEEVEEQQQQFPQEMLPQQQPIRPRPPVQIFSRPSKRPVITRKVATVSKISNISKSTAKRKKKKVKCKTVGNIADPEDDTSYWHCFKSIPDNRMKRIHKKCSLNLVFCPDTRYCSPSC